MSVPAQAAVDASAARASGRSNAFLVRCQEVVRDFPLASDRGFRSARVESERRILPEPLLWLARRDARKWRRVQRLQDAWQKAVHRMVPRVLAVLQIVSLTAPRQQQAQTDESVLLRAHLLRVQLASRLEAPPLV